MTNKEDIEQLKTECRDTAIENNLPLYFVYYEETGKLQFSEKLLR